MRFAIVLLLAGCGFEGLPIEDTEAPSLSKAVHCAVCAACVSTCCEPDPRITPPPDCAYCLHAFCR